MLLSSDQDGDKQLSSDDGCALSQRYHPTSLLFRLSTIEDQTSRRKVRTTKEGTGESEDHEQRKQGLYGTNQGAGVCLD